MQPQKASWDGLSKIFAVESGEEIDPRAADNILLAWPVMLHMLEGMAPKSDILDFGCGTGGFAKKLQSLGHSVRGIDSSSEMLAIAKRAPEGVLFGSDELLTTCDAIVSIMVFQFISDEEIGALLSKLTSHLKPHGRFIFAVHNADYVRNAMQFTNKYSRDEAGRHFIHFKEHGAMQLYLRSSDDYRRILEPLGVKVKEVATPEFTAEYIRSYKATANEPLEGSKFLIMSFEW